MEIEIEELKGEVVELEELLEAANSDNKVHLERIKMLETLLRECIYTLEVIQGEAGDKIYEIKNKQ